MEKSPALSSCEHDMKLEANRLGDVVTQACLSVARMMKVVENTHNLEDSRGPPSEAAPRESLC